MVTTGALQTIFLIKNLVQLTLPKSFSVGHHQLLTQWTDLPKINWIYVVDLNHQSQDFLSAWYSARNRRNIFVLQKLADVASSNFQGLFEKDTFKSPLSLKFWVFKDWAILSVSTVLVQKFYFCTKFKIHQVFFQCYYWSRFFTPTIFYKYKVWRKSKIQNYKLFVFITPTFHLWTVPFHSPGSIILDFPYLSQYFFFQNTMMCLPTVLTISNL